MLNHYRRGERVERTISTSNRGRKAETSPSKSLRKGGKPKAQGKKKKEKPAEVEIIQLDGLASDWTEEETLMAQLVSNRSKDDIPIKEFHNYQGCVNETLEVPDEVWSVSLRGSVKLIHFLRYYPEENPQMWYIVVARQSEEEDGIEILDAFPTKDIQLVDCYRKGEQQVGSSDTQMVTRTVH